MSHGKMAGNDVFAITDGRFSSQWQSPEKETIFHHDGNDVGIFFGVVNGRHAILIFLHFPTMKPKRSCDVIEEREGIDCADGSDHEPIMSSTIHVMLIKTSAKISLV